MALPLIGAALGAGGSIISSILGAGAADDNWQWQYAINAYNQRKQERARNDAMAYADEIRKEDQKGGTDAYGNRTYFDPVRGWVTELSPQQQGLLDYFYSQELPERRGQFNREAERSRTESDQADQLLDQFNRVTRESPAELEAQLYEKATRGISESTSEGMEAALRHAAKTGNTNTGSLIAEFQRQANEARGNAAKDASLNARDVINNEYNNERNQLAQLYGNFANASGEDLGTSYDPANVKPDNLLSQFLNSAAQGKAAGVNARAMVGGQMQPMEANNSWANAAASIGGSLNSAFNRAGAYFDKDANNQLLQAFLTSGGQLDFGGGGFFGRTADRVNLGGSNF